MAKQTTTFAENLKFYRNKHGYTQTELAEKVGKTRNTYAQYENGYSTPPLELLVKLARVLECSIDALLTEEKEEETPALPEVLNKDISFLNTYNMLNTENKNFFDDYLAFLEANTQEALKTKKKAM